MLKYRILTAIILIPLLLWAIFSFTYEEYKLLVAVVFGLAALEWAWLVGLKHKLASIVFLIIVWILFWLSDKLPAIYFLIIGVLWWFAVVYLLSYRERWSSLWEKYRSVRLFVGIIILVCAWSSVNFLRYVTNPLTILGFLLIVWSIDTGAYLAGSLWGKSPLAPEISPKKTKEGFWGGLGLAFIIGLLVGLMLKFSGWQLVLFEILVILTGLFCVVGDLFESYVKRLSQVKDSGKILPGHGGLLDRIDSLFAAAPVFTLGLFVLLM